MEIEIKRIIPYEEFFKMLRQVPLKKPGPDSQPVYPYKNATISLKEFHPDEVNPPTFYLLRKQLEIQRELRDVLADRHQIDLFNLPGILEFQNKEGQIWTLSPPVIEITPRKVKYVAQEGEINHNNEVKVNIPLICDGAHRVYLAREFNSMFTGINIVGALETHAYYAHPNGWDLVNVFDAVPSTMAQKKMYRFVDSYALYRDFESLGLGKPRGTG